MAVDYSDPEASLKRLQAARAAKDGLLPEGRYNVMLGNVRYHGGDNPQKIIWRWDLILIFQKPGTPYNRAERKMSYFESDAKMHLERMPEFFEILKRMGLNISKGGDTTPRPGVEETSTDRILEWFHLAFMERMAFQVDVKNRYKNVKDPQTNLWEEVLDEKYQDYSPVLETIPPVITAVKQRQEAEAGNQPEGEDLQDGPQGEDGQQELPVDPPVGQPVSQPAVQVAGRAQGQMQASAPTAASTKQVIANKLAAQSTGRVASPFGNQGKR